MLHTPREELIRRADLEEETVDNVIEILRAEFEDDAESPAGETPAAKAPAAEAPAAEGDSCAETSDPAEDLSAVADAQDEAPKAE